MVIVSQEEIQSKPVVSAQFYLWNILDLLRYVYLIGTKTLKGFGLHIFVLTQH
jgi:hypothetical protein